MKAAASAAMQIRPTVRAALVCLGKVERTQFARNMLVCFVFLPSSSFLVQQLSCHTRDLRLETVLRDILQPEFHEYSNVAIFALVPSILSQV